ncbi:MAG TPA: SelB C-terminal domain-containing protein, partial [Dehalococcoidia bacterium]|nr:SelB C-terminal domain-containing protein [Dehalococcoidia bacterium]
DRAFAVQGFGVVVTGTLVDGSFEVGQEVELQPGRVRARIRGLQRHRSHVNRLGPGTRAAVNLSGVRLEDVRRGMVLALPGTVAPARAVDVRLRATRLIAHPLQHDAGVTFLSSTAESESKLRLLDREQLEAGEEAWAQFVLSVPAPVLSGDHCVVRTSNDTIAGGRVVVVNPRRHRRNDPQVLVALELMLEGTPEDRLLDLLLGGPQSRDGVGQLLSTAEVEVERALEALVARGDVFVHSGLLLSHVWLDGAVSRLLGTVEDYLADHKLRASAPREHVRGALALEPLPFDSVAAAGVAGGQLEEVGAGLAPSGYEVQLSEKQQRQVDGFLHAIRQGGSSPPTDGLPAADLLAYLAERELVEDTGSGVVFDRDVFGQMSQRILSYLEEHGSITLAEGRDLFGTSRKYAQAFLEHLDNLRATRRVGDSRVLRNPRRRN